MMGVANLKALLFLLLITSLAFPAMNCIANATEVITGPTYGMSGLLLAVIGLTIMVITMAYIIGSVFTNASYLIFAKDEFYHLLFSLMILGGFSSILLMSCSIVDIFYGTIFDNLGTLPSGCFSSGGTMSHVAQCYLAKARGDAIGIAQNYVDNYIGKLMESTYSWSIQLPMVNSYTSTAGAYKRVVSSQYDIVLNSFLIPALMSISMQKLALDFVSENLINWVLPSAFVLRFFIPTRQMGNMLIALVLALYVLVPFMYVFNSAMYDALLTGNDCVTFQNAVCDFAIDGTDCSAACSNTNGFWYVGRLIPQAFFLPNLTISIVITFLSAMNKALKVIG